jgi:amino acid transporter
MSFFVRAIIFVYLVDVLILLIPLFGQGESAFYSITGVATIGFQVSYAMPILVKLIYAFDNFPETVVNFGSGTRGKIISNVCGVISCVWLLGTTCILFLPTGSPVLYSGPDNNMNWSVVVVAGFAFVAAVHWLSWAKDNFVGPLGRGNKAVDAECSLNKGEEEEKQKEDKIALA